MVAHIKHIVWDLDNTLYPYTEAQLEHWHEAAVKAAQYMGVEIDFNEGVPLARESYARYHYSHYVFERDYGLCGKAMHDVVVKYAQETIIPICTLTPQMFERLPHIRHVILTHGHKDWAERVLRHLGIRDYFETQHILALEDYDFKVKDLCNTGLQKALDVIGGASKDSLFAEDTLKNLAKGKELGVTTAYIHHGMFKQGNDNQPDFVDHSYNKAHELLSDIQKTQQQQRDVV